MKNFTFEFTNGQEKTSQGSDVWDALKNLGHNKEAMTHIVVKYKQA